MNFTIDLATEEEYIEFIKHMAKRRYKWLSGHKLITPERDWNWFCGVKSTPYTTDSLALMIDVDNKKMAFVPSFDKDFQMILFDDDWKGRV